MNASADLRSPIQGTVLRVVVEPGATVEAGQLICIVEAMKMENEIGAQHAGTVREMRVAAGQAVQVGALIASIEPAANE
jgi:acetyl-CoA/propionyl-CoA carboxylase biotin carboxyl carrier protein